tara:strand:- start:4797 stop:5363 length:567 start_codon:yes stop_codon:yes gene_type:complete
MRIVAGKFKGSALHLPKDENTRPLKDMVRESIFNLLTHSNTVSLQLRQANVLDLYAGTGSFGLECLSREVRHVCFIENHKTAFDILEKNIEKLKIKKKTKTFFDDVFKLIEQNTFNSKFDLIFCDPPYKDLVAGHLIELIFNKSLLKKNGIIILHINKRAKDELPKNFYMLDERIYGTSKIIFGKLLL